MYKLTYKIVTKVSKSNLTSNIFLEYLRIGCNIFYFHRLSMFDFGSLTGLRYVFAKTTADMISILQKFWTYND